MPFVRAPYWRGTSIAAVPGWRVGLGDPSIAPGYQGLNLTISNDNGPDYFSPEALSQFEQWAVGPVGPNADNSVSGLFNSIIGSANAGSTALPTGQQAAAGVTAAKTTSWLPWALGGAGLFLVLMSSGGRRR